MKKLGRLTLIVLSFSSAQAWAEYRAYQYLVIEKNVLDESADRAKGQIIVSTMNPRTYIAYNGGSQMVNVDLLRTWICPGHTGKREICPSPYAQLSNEDLP